MNLILDFHSHGPDGVCKLCSTVKSQWMRDTHGPQERLREQSFSWVTHHSDISREPQCKTRISPLLQRMLDFPPFLKWFCKLHSCISVKKPKKQKKNLHILEDDI